MAYLGRTKETVMYFGANQETQELAKILRRKLTPMEKVLWQNLKNKNILGVKFRRQQPIWFYIADFYCHELKLVIEVDGPIHQHQERKEKDQNRTAELDRFGIRVLRFTNNNIKNNIGSVMRRIREVIKERKENVENL